MSSIIPEDPIEKRRRLLERQRSTYMAHGQSSADDEAGGRFRATGTPTVVGTTPIPKYPELPSGPWAGTDPVPNEPPLGININAMPELGQDLTGVLPMSHRPVVTGGPSDAPSSIATPSTSERGGPPSSSDGGGNDAA